MRAHDSWRSWRLSGRRELAQGAVRRSEPARQEPVFAWRLALISVCFASAFLVLAWRVIDLQVLQYEFLSNEGDQRTVRVQTLYANRGNIYDRNGEPLAISAPAYTIHANPRVMMASAEQIQALADALELPFQEVERLVGGERRRGFVYLARQVSPEVAERVGEVLREYRIQGVYRERDSKRYYPAGEVASHLTGFTNIDNRGQEGLELIFDKWLTGVPGERKVMINARQDVIKHLGLQQEAVPGRDLHLSVDLRLQFHAYRELKAAVQAHAAQSGSIVLLDVHSGEVLAMANLPGFNPNDRASLVPDHVRNRAITDVFEPGSTVKPFTVAAALSTGKFSASSDINTSPGFIRVNGRTIRDLKDYGVLSVSEVISKSSNVGTSRIALATGGDVVREQFFQVGLGQATGIEFPGEAVGTLPSYPKWRPVNLATLSYGYGLSVTALQLAQAYATIGAGGERHPVTLLKDGARNHPSENVMPGWVARQVMQMLEHAVAKGGTGTRAQTVNYRVAGKTGTAHKVGVGGYQDDQYLAVFAGLAPVEQPRLAMVVVVSAPQKGEYYGGEVAAPVFSRVMASALRILNVVPDTRPMPKVAQETHGVRNHG